MPARPRIDRMRPNPRLAQHLLLILALAGWGLCFAPAPPRVARAAPPPAPAARRLVLRLARADLLPAAGARAALRRALGEPVAAPSASLPARDGSVYAVLELPRPLSGQALAAAVYAAGQAAGVLSAAPEAHFTAALIPDDPLFQQYQSNLHGPHGINAPPAWDLSLGDSVSVAVLDTGVTDHPELDGQRLSSGFDFISNPLASNDGDGWDPDAHDAGDYTAAQNSTWHGTHVTGIIHAAGNNASGLAGVAWGARFVPVRVLGAGGGDAFDLAAAIAWAAGLPVAGAPDNPHPAKVINLSLGAVGACPDYIQDALDRASAAGAIVVAASGNEGASASQFWPANCAGVIAVTSIDQASGSYPPYANTGPGVAVGAPGQAILSTWNYGTQAPGQPALGILYGTSMAAPHVSAVIALLASVHPALTTAGARALLTATARPYPPGSNCLPGLCGAGSLDAFATLQAALRQPPRSTCPGAPVSACAAYLPILTRPQ